jgi:general L-amino acid transport system permease protein
MDGRRPDGVPDAGKEGHPDGWSGACWAFVSKFGQFMFGRYPLDERWRVILTAILFVGLLAPLLIPRAPYKGINAILFFLVFPFVASSCWSAAISACPMSRPALGRAAGDAGDLHVGIVVSLPLGIMLALGRRSKMPAIASVGDLHRGGARRAA